MQFTEANTHYLHDLSGGDQAIILEIVSLFLKQTPNDLQKLASHLSNENRTGIRSMAHHIKPTLAYVGAESMRQELQQLEHLATQEDTPISELAGRFGNLSKRFDILFAELRSYLTTLSA